jgi:type III secretion protein J
MRAFACLFLLVLLLAGCRMDLYTGLSEKDANDMLALLLENDINADKKPGDRGVWRLTVNKGDLPRSMALLNAHALPRVPYSSLGQVFRKEGIISTPLEERARFMYALAQELGGSIAIIDGVLDARVHLVLPEQDSLGARGTPASASVLVRYRPGTEMGEHVHQIKKLLENGVRGLQYDAITVLLFPADEPLSRQMPLVVAAGPPVQAWAGAALGSAVTALAAFGLFFLWRRRKAAGGE